MTPRTTEPDPDQTSSVRRAYAAVERMRRRLDELEDERTQPIAIVGMACRFPGGVEGPEDLWDLLMRSGDAIGEVPASRWDPEKVEGSPRWGGFLDRVDRFDHEFFGISHREAVSMDPQQRIALEVTWHALESAGIAPGSLAGTATDVYMGVCGNDYYRQVFRSPEHIVAHASTGTAHSILSGRISYSLDLRGASVSVDTACSSSLVALDQACRGLRSGQSDTALCGAVNTVLSPDAGISFSQFPQMLAADGRCKTFDASADGFVRSEGCGVLVLRRLSDARRDGDRVLAVIRGSAVNQDGRSSGLTAPNGRAQAELLRRALHQARVSPEQVGLVETHGAGTSLGDPIEVDALSEVYGRADGPPLYLGAVKTNLGHLEGASGMAGLIKTVLCLQHGLIPPNLHLETPNPHLSFDGTGFALPAEPVPWPLAEGPRYASVSSFGFSGTNTHVVLEQAPEPAPLPPGGPRPRSVLTLSARSEARLLELARRYADLVRGLDDDGRLSRVCGAANTGRSALEHRLAVTGASREEVAAGLAGHVRGESGPGAVAGRADAEPPGVVFLFTGQGGQHPGMARELYEGEPVFRECLDRCDELLRPELEVPLLEVLHPRDPESALVHDMEYAQPALFAVEYALARLWESWGVRPAAVLGHSLGEYVAACVAGVVSLPDALRIVAARGRLLGSLSGRGAMATVFTCEERVAAQVAGQAEVSIAAVNGAENTTVSGTPEAVERVRAAFHEQGVDSRALRISTASHSPLVEEVLEPLRRELEKVAFHPPRLPLVSNVTGGFLPWESAPGPDYWCGHTRAPVRFADGVRTLGEHGHGVFVEVGPSATLAGPAAEALGPDALVVPSLRRGHPALESLLPALGSLYVRGVDIDWTAFEGGRVHSPVALPRYPFKPVRCWHSVDGTFVAQETGAALSGERSGQGADGHRDEQAGEAAPRSPLDGSAPTLPSAEEVLALPPDERAAFLTGPLLAGVRAALGSRSSSVTADRPLLETGLDSLMAVELRNEIRRRLAVEVPVSSFLAGASVRDVAEDICARLDGERPAAVPELRRRSDPPPGPVGAAPRAQGPVTGRAGGPVAAQHGAGGSHE